MQCVCVCVVRCHVFGIEIRHVHAGENFANIRKLMGNFASSSPLGIIMSRAPAANQACKSRIRENNCVSADDITHIFCVFPSPYYSPRLFSECARVPRTKVGRWSHFSPRVRRECPPTEARAHVIQNIYVRCEYRAATAETKRLVIPHGRRTANGRNAHESFLVRAATATTTTQR